MHLQGSLAAVAAFGKPEYFPDVRRNIDREWVEQALQATGTATIRRRRLPAEQVVWLVIGMALYRNRSIHDIVSKLDLVLPGESPTVVPSAVADARARLGAAPMEWRDVRMSGRIAVRGAMPGEGSRFMGSTDRRCAYRTPTRTERPSASPTATAARARTRSREWSD